eukprot:TRINITY_DN2185_c0_g1_i1.p4 TRINITY_DN2185_c0_g1~~TRINITY_DN2185_c0_g1_i1.p4  ORF type:complete len:54 (+),score=3.82 TRINITY_DN2185_c0_g1_i1:136-297(+)
MHANKKTSSVRIRHRFEPIILVDLVGLVEPERLLDSGEGSSFGSEGVVSSLTE